MLFRSTTVLNYEDTIFLDETISPIGLFGQVSTMDDETANDNHLSVYAGYLSRAGKKLHDDENYYINILQNGALPSGHLNVNGEVITITDKTVTIELPYYYLKDENDIVPMPEEICTRLTRPVQLPIPGKRLTREDIR